MEKLCIHKLNHSKYIACISILDYEIVLSRCLGEIKFDAASQLERYVLVDVALKSGIDQYRFVEYVVNCDGTIDVNRYSYVELDSFIKNIANGFLNEYKTFVINSMLSESEKRKILT